MSYPYPYSPLFLIGLICAVFGTLVWPLVFYTNVSISEPLLMHKLVLFGGFLLSFAYGFIITAFPNFTGTALVRIGELIPVVCGQIMILTGLFLDNPTVSFVGLFLAAAATFNFVKSRLRYSRFVLPPSAIYVAVGFFMALIGFSLEASVYYLGTDVPKAIRDSLIQYGLVLNLVLGVGLKILPVFLGVQKTKKFSIEETVQSKIAEFMSKNKLTLQLIALNLLLLLDIFDYAAFANLGRALIVGWIFVEQIKITKTPEVKSFLTYGVWVSLWSMVVGLFLRSIPLFDIFGVHVYFISGFALLTLMIAGRVTLSHGGFSLDFERRSRTIYYVIVFSILSGLLRFLPSMSNHLGFEVYIALSWLAWFTFILIWFVTYGAKLIAPLKRSK